MAEWMSSAQAAAALGVKTSSLYAYVSRGLIAREVTVADGRRVSRFAREEVLALAHARNRPRGGVAAALIESQVSSLDAEGGLSFRGVDVATCAAWGFERTAGHVLGPAGEHWARGTTVGDAVPRPGQVTEPRPGGARTTDVIRRVVLEGSGTDDDRDDVSPEHCAIVARTVVENAVRAMTGHARGGAAYRLGQWWTGGPRESPSDDRERDPVAVAHAVDAAVARAIDVALAVMVDHELTASTVASRAAAGVRADPWMVLLAGLAVLAGPLHARSPEAALAVLRAWRQGRPPAAGRVPGFGHTVYVGPDPRAVLVLDEVERVDARVRDAVESLALFVVRRDGTHPNSDLALAALVEAAGLPDDAGEVIFTLARIPGLMAHALEEYPHELRFRLRAIT